jgi:hypothetical protein
MQAWKILVVLFGLLICIAPVLAEDTALVPDVYNQFIDLKHHGEPLGFHLGSGMPVPSLTNHYQGIQRLSSPGTPYLVVSRSGEEVANLLVVKMESRNSMGERFRSNRLVKGSFTEVTAPPISDRGVFNVYFDGSAWPQYAHAGGLQIVDDVLAVPLENPGDDQLPEGMIVFVDLADPEAPINLRQIGLSHKAGAVAITRQPSGRFLMIVIGPDDNKKILVYESNVDNLRDPNLDFSLIDEWEMGELEGNPFPEPVSIWPTKYKGYQAINFVRQSDGQLFLIGTHNTLDIPPGVGTDYAELYQVVFRDDEFKLIYVAQKHLYCENAGSGRMCNLAAAGGVYISPSGELILYSTEHYNDGPQDSVRMAEFRDEYVNRCDSPLHRPNADVGGPIVVPEGSSIVLIGSALPPYGKPWAELYDDDHFRDRSLMFDWEDRNKDDANDFDANEGFEDKASAVRWQAPKGCDIILYKDKNYGGDQLKLEGTGRVQEIANLNQDGYDFGDETSSIAFMGPTCEGNDMIFAWDLNGDGIYETPGMTAEFNAALLDGPTTLDVGLEVCGVYLDCDIATTTITVTNVAPTVYAGTDTIMNEGVEIIISGWFTDPGEADGWTGTVDYGDGTPVQTLSLNLDKTFTLSHAYGDNKISGAPFTVTVTVTDKDGGTGSDAVEVTVTNINPTASIDSIGQPNPHFILPEVHTLTFNGVFTDPGWLDTHTSVWDFGDGTILDGILEEENVAPDSKGTSIQSHVYAQPGSYTALLTVQDDDGGVGSDQKTLEVISAQQAMDFLASYIQSLPEDGFKSNPTQRKNALHEKYLEIIESIDAEDYQGAKQSLLNDVRAKADGTLGGKTADDWITNAQAQSEICGMIDSISAYLDILRIRS